MLHAHTQTPLPLGIQPCSSCIGYPAVGCVALRAHPGAVSLSVSLRSRGLFRSFQLTLVIPASSVNLSCPPPFSLCLSISLCLSLGMLSLLSRLSDMTGRSRTVGGRPRTPSRDAMWKSSKFGYGTVGSTRMCEAGYATVKSPQINLNINLNLAGFSG